MVSISGNDCCLPSFLTCMLLPLNYYHEPVGPHAAGGSRPDITVNDTHVCYRMWWEEGDSGLRINTTNYATWSGQNYSITCKAIAVPSAWISHNLVDSRETQGNNYTNIKFSPTAQDHGKNVNCTTCCPVNAIKITLAVIHGPNALYISDLSENQGRFDTNSSFIAVENVTYTMHCKTDSVYPNATLRWNWPVSGFSSRVEVAEGTNEALIYQRNITFTADRSMHLTKATCSAAAVMTGLNITEDIWVKVEYGPKTLAIKTLHRTINKSAYDVLTNTSLSLTCETDDVNPYVNMTWSHGAVGRVMNVSGGFQLKTIIDVTPKWNQFTVVCSAIRSPPAGSTWTQRFVKLNVLHGPTTLYISDLSEQRGFFDDTESSFSTVENVTHTIQCTTDSVYPKATLRWDWPMAAVLSKLEVTKSVDGGFVYKTNLTFTAGRHMNLAVAKCLAVASATNSTVTRQFQVNVAYGPTTLYISDLSEQRGFFDDTESSFSTVENVTHTIQCTTDSVYPKATLRWDWPMAAVLSKLEVTKSVDGGFVYKTNLTFTAGRHMNLAVAKCLAVASATNSTVTRQFQVNVAYGPTTLYISDLSEQRGSFGDTDGSFSTVENVTYTIQCATDLVFPNASLRWDWAMTGFLSKLEVTNGVNGGFFYKRNLTFTAGRRMNSAIAKCFVVASATNFTDTRRFHVHVAYGPRRLTIKTPRGIVTETEHNVLTNTSLALTCETDSVNPYVNMTWSHGATSHILNVNGRFQLNSSIDVTPTWNQVTVVCRAIRSPPRGSIWIQRFVKLNVLYGPTTLYISDLSEQRGTFGDTESSFSTVENVTYTIQCATDLVFPNATLRWDWPMTGFLSRLEVTNGFNSGFVYKRNLTFTAGRRMNLAKAKCFAVASATNSTVTRQFQVNVAYGPRTLTIKTPHGIVAETEHNILTNTSLQLICETDYVNPYVNMTWSHGATSHILNVKGRFQLNSSIDVTPTWNQVTVVCHAIRSPPRSSMWIQRFVKLNVVYGPTTLYISDLSEQRGFFDGTVSSFSTVGNVTYTIQCATDSVYPNATLSWSWPVTGCLSNAEVIKGANSGFVYMRNLTFTAGRSINLAVAKCFAVNSATNSTVARQFYVNVAYGPKTLTIKTSGRVITETAHNVLTNTSLALTCETDSVNPNVNMTWSHGKISHILNLNGRFQLNSSIDVTPMWNQVTVVCRAIRSPPTGSTWIQRAVKLNVLYGPTTLYISDLSEQRGSFDDTNSSFSTVENVAYTIQCATNSVYPNATLSWIWPVTGCLSMVEVTKSANSGFVYKRNLTFTAGKSINLAIAKCFAVASATNSTVTRQFQVNVAYGPKTLTIKTPLGVITERTHNVLTNTSLALTCETDSVNPYVNMTWSHGTTSHVLNVKGRFQLNSSITVTPMWNQVIVVCRAIRSPPRGSMWIQRFVKLSVLYGPTALYISDLKDQPGSFKDTDNTFSTVENVTYTIQCTTDSVYPNATLTWNWPMTGVLSKVEVINGVNGGFAYKRNLTFTAGRSMNLAIAKCSAVASLTNVTVTRQVHVNVAYGPTAVYISDLSEQPGSFDDIDNTFSTLENLTYTIQCRTDNVYPNATLRWDWPLTGVSPKVEVTKGVNGGFAYKRNLTFTAERSLNLARLKCSAVASATNYTVTRQFHVNVAYGPTKVDITGTASIHGRILTPLNQPLTLQCTTDEVFPNASLQWVTSISGSQRRTERREIRERTFVFTRTFTFVPAVDHQDLGIRCQATNDFTKITTRTDVKIQLTSFYGPKGVTFVDKVTSDVLKTQHSVFENQKVEIDCQTTEVHPSANVTWRVNDITKSRLSYDIAPTVCILASRFLVCSKKIAFRADRRFHSSRLVCIATNAAVNQFTARDEVEIIVKFGPDKTTLSSSIEYALVGDVVQMSCSTDHVYPNASIFWEQDLTGASASEDHVEANSQPGGESYTWTSSFMFNASRTDNGKLVRCHAQNIVPGVRRVFSELKINVAYGPNSLRWAFSGVHKCSSSTCAVPTGTLFVIQCITDDVSPAVRIVYVFKRGSISWHKQPRIWPVANLSYRGIFAVNVTSDYDGSSITCVAQNGRRPRKAQRIKFSLVVLVGPTRVTITQTGGRWGPNNAIVVTQDSIVDLKCVTDFCKEGVFITFHIYMPSSRQESLLPDEGPVKVGRGIYASEVSLFITSKQHGVRIRCKASNKKSDYLSASSSVVMDVLVPVVPLRITAFHCWGGRRDRGGTWVLMLGARVILYCSTDRSFQEVSFKFQFRLKSGTTFEANTKGERSAYGTFRGKYVLEVSNDYDKSTVWCFATNVREPSLSASSRLNIKVFGGGPPRGPHTVDMFLRNTKGVNGGVVVASNGTLLVVMCRSGVANSGSHISIRLVTVEGTTTRLVARGMRTFDNNTNEASSSAIVTTEHHAGTVECVARNTRAPKMKASTSRILDITFGPLDLKIESADEVTEVNDNVIVVANATKATIRCVAKIHPAGTTSLFSNMMVSTEETVFTRKNGVNWIEKELSFTRYMGHETEKFTCSVNNSRDQSITASVTMELKVVVHGGWSAWLQWEICNAACDLGTQKRIRTCTNPPPSDNGGKYCPGWQKHFRACLREIPCDPQGKRFDYLWNHVVDALETNNLLIFLLVVCAVTFIVMFIWYKRNEYLDDVKREQARAAEEFDALFTRIARLKGMRTGSVGGDNEVLGRKWLLDQLRRTDEGHVVGRFMDVCDKMTTEDISKSPRKVDRHSISLLKHEVNKLSLMMSLRSSDRPRIEEALRNYACTAADLKEQDQLEDLDLVKKSRNMVLALSLRSTINEMENVHDLDGMERMLSVVVGKGLCGVLEEFRTAKERLEKLQTMSRCRKVLLHLSKNRIAELRSYRNPPRAVRATVVASLLILGVNEHDMSSWLGCMQICNSSQGFEWLLEHFTLDQLRPSVAARALDILNRYCSEDIKVVSKTAYHIYAWAHAIATLRLSMKGDSDSGRRRRRSSQSERIFSIIEQDGR